MKKRYPTSKSLQLIVCDDVKREDSGKLFLSGFFPGEQVVVTQGGPLPDANIVAAIDTLTLAFLVKNGSGSFDVHLRIEAPDQSSVFDQAAGQLTLLGHGTGVFAVKLRPLLIRAFGKHNVTLRLDDHQYAMAFEVNEASQPVSALPKQAA